MPSAIPPISVQVISPISGSSLPITVDVLILAARYVRRGWVRGASAAKVDGSPCLPWSAHAYLFSMWGAIARAVTDRNAPVTTEGEAANAVVRTFNPNHFSGTIDVANWHDDPATTQLEVETHLLDAAKDVLTGGLARTLSVAMQSQAGIPFSTQLKTFCNEQVSAAKCVCGVWKTGGNHSDWCNPS